MKIQGFIILLFSYTVASQNCDSAGGWQEYNGKCLRVSRSAPETQYTWQEAREACMSEGGDLASIHSQEEQDFIIDLALSIGLTGSKIWIGMSQGDSKTGPFGWSDGSEAVWDDWAASEPRTSGLTNCAYTLTEEQPSGSFVRYDYYETTSGILDPDFGHVPQMADGVNTFYFGGGYQYDRTWCEYMCTLNERCAAYSWYGYHYNYNWEHQCVGRSDLYDILEYDSYAYSGVRTLGTPDGWWVTSNCGLNHGFTCKKDIGSDTPVTIPPTVPVESYCPEGYFSADVHTGNKCYRMFSVASEAQGIRWEQALLYCRNQPGVNPDLASIHSMEENAIITARIQDFNVGYWIGSHYASAHDKWVWADNVEPVYNNWAPGRPAGSGQCGEMWAVTGPGSWTNTECDSGRGFICQTYKDADNIIPTPPVTPTPSCPEGWFQYWYACYKLDTTPRTWADAKTNCESLHTNSSLVSIHSESENAAVFLGGSGNHPMWIGLHKESPEDDTYKWTDNWPNYYANFDTDGTSNGQGCVVMKDNDKWNDTLCTNTHASLCKFTNISTPDIPPPGEGGCPVGNWLQWGGHCYFFSSETDTYVNSITRCQILAGSSHTGTLVSITNAAENQFIYQNLAAVQFRTYAWIGLRFDTASAEFIWLDGSDNTYKNWAPGQPNNPYGEPCGEMDANVYGMWNDYSCGSTTYQYYVCKADLGPAATYPPVPTSGPGECPSVEWVKSTSGDDCYLVRPTQDLHWHAALEVCKTLTGGEGSLSSVRSQEENQFIFYWADYLTPDFETPSTWIGLYKQGLGYPYIWEDGSSTEYLNWAPGEPNDVDGTSNCVRMYTSHTDPLYIAKWDDYYCSDYYNHGYVCRTSQGSYQHLDQEAINRKVQRIVDDAHRNRTIKKKEGRRQKPKEEAAVDAIKEEHNPFDDLVDEPQKIENPSELFEKMLMQSLKHKEDQIVDRIPPDAMKKINERAEKYKNMDFPGIGHPSHLNYHEMTKQQASENGKDSSGIGPTLGIVAGVVVGTLVMALMVVAYRNKRKTMKDAENPSSIATIDVDVTQL